MPTKRKAGALSSGPSPAKGASSTTKNNHGTSSASKARTNVKSIKKETTQSHTLFDFYPNLSKNAPLFRPVLNTADEPLSGATGQQSSALRSDQREKHEHAMSVLSSVVKQAQSGSCTEECTSQPTDVGIAAFGPFSLDDDDDGDHDVDRIHDAQQDLRTSTTSTSSTDDEEDNTTGERSDVGTEKTSETSLGETEEERYASALSEQIEEYHNEASAGEEIDMKEERDRFENADDEVNEDEEWTWQEYNAEEFGQHASRDDDDSVLCPMCGLSIIGLSEHDRSAHVNRCLDLPPPSENENQVDGKDLIDATVAREMSRLAAPQLVKTESCAPDVKLEPPGATDSVLESAKIKSEPSDEVLRIKSEPMDDEIEDYSEGDVKIETRDPIKMEQPTIDSKDGIKDEVEDVKPNLARGASNAFEKIMVGHSEEKQWADAARTENLQRGTKYKTRVCPFYKILSPFPIAVDAFKYGTVPGVEGYYLTHFHSDHYGGLSSTWDAGPIYCSSITGSLVIQQLRVRPEYVVKLPMDVPTDINGITVTCIDANHCPGSTLFLFEGQARGRTLRYLHCGDYRATPPQLLHPQVRGKHIDSLYLDTTYLSPKYAFPSQEDVIEACSHVCRDLAGLLPADNNPVADARNATGISKFLNSNNQQNNGGGGGGVDDTTGASLPPARVVKDRGRLLVVVGTYSIGKERIVLGIAKALGSKIYAAQRKRDILACLEDAELAARITSDPLEAQVHMTYLQEIRAETLLEYMHSFRGVFKRVVGFRGTGWTYAPPKTRFLDNPSVEQIMAWNPRYSFRMMSPGRGSSSIAACYGVPYSEHSSFRELMCFCLSVRVGRVIPTVNVGSEKSRKNMKGWIDKWALEVRKNGVRPIKDGSTTWE